MTVRYGIISTAQIVPRFVEGVRQSKEGKITAIASRSIEKAEKMAGELSIPKAYGSYEALCQDEAVDIIYIATYNKGHYEAAKLALSYDKHVLLEKPFTLTTAEAIELFELAQKKTLFLMEAQKAVFLPITQEVKALIHQKAIGKIQFVNSVTAYPNIEHLTWFHSLDSGGGLLHGSGSYPLHYLSYLFGDIEEYSGSANVSKGVDEQVNITVKFDSDLLANLFLTVKLDLPSKLTLYGEKGRIEIPDFWKAKRAMIYDNFGHEEEIFSTFENEFTFEVDHVNTCIKNKQITSSIMTKERTIQTVNLVESFYKQWFR